MKLPLYDRVALRVDVPDKGLKKGDVVTTVEFLQARRDLPNAYVVEAFNAVGETIAVLTVPESDLEALTGNDILMRRSLPQGSMIVVNPPAQLTAEKEVDSLTDTLTFEVSRSLLETNNLNKADVKLEVAIVLFQKKLYSLGKASEYAGLHASQFQKELASRQIPLHYDVEDYRHDINLLDQDEALKQRFLMTS